MVDPVPQDTADNRQSFPGNIIHAVSFPEQYYIRYEVTRKDETIETVTRTKDATGNIYFQSGEQESLFIRGDNGTFTSGGKTYTVQYVEEFTKAFTTMAETSRQKYPPTIKAAGDTEVAGRECESYEINVGFANFKKTYLLQVDKETGICLGWYESTSVSGYAAASDVDVFTCTEFQTDGIDLLTQETGSQ